LTKSASIAAVLSEATAIRKSGDEVAAAMREIAEAIVTLGVALAADEQELLRVSDAATILGVGSDTIRRAIAADHIRAVRIGPGRTAVRIRRADLMTYAASLV
jgi:excisionase family DNA binding protein